MRIIVDKLPEHCGKCLFINKNRSNSRASCSLTKKSLLAGCWDAPNINPEHPRSEYCPLMALKDAIDNKS